MCAEGRAPTTLGILADLVGGRVSGDPSTIIKGVAALDRAENGDICFLADPKQAKRLAGCRAAAVIVPSGLEKTLDLPLVRVDNPYLAFAKVLNHFHGAVPPCEGVSPAATVHPGACLDKDVIIGPGCVIGDGAVIGRGSWLHPNVVVYANAVIGEDCLIHANVVIREGCRLGDRVILQPGVTIGADGFGYVPDGERHYKIPQVGRVVLEDDVEVGAGSCIDRGTLDDTRIAAGTKIDNLVQIGHNVQVGEHTILVSQVGIGGSVQIGRHCTFGGQVAVTDHVTIGDNVVLGGRAGVTKDVASKQVLSGLPAMPHRKWLRATQVFTHLPEMHRDLQRLKRQVLSQHDNHEEDEN